MVHSENFAWRKMKLLQFSHIPQLLTGFEDKNLSLRNNLYLSEIIHISEKYSGEKVFLLDRGEETSQ